MWRSAARARRRVGGPGGLLRVGRLLRRRLRILLRLVERRGQAGDRRLVLPAGGVDAVGEPAPAAVADAVGVAALRAALEAAVERLQRRRVRALHEAGVEALRV